MCLNTTLLVWKYEKNVFEILSSFGVPNALLQLFGSGLPDMETRNWPKYLQKLAKVSTEIGQNWPL